MAVGIKFTYDEVKAYIESFGCKLISPEYTNIKDKILVLGTCGHEYYTSFDGFKCKKKHVCPSCGHSRGGKERKFSYDEVFTYIKNKKCLLLSKEYNRNSDLLEIKFSCGHVGKRSFADFKTCNPVCYDCSGIKKYEKSEMIEYLSENNYIYIGGDYKSVFSEISVMDNFGYKYFSPYSHLRFALQRGHRIREIDIRNPFTIDNIKNWLTINNKNFSLLDTEYKGKDFKMSWQCKNKNCGEIFVTHWATILRGSGCPYCSIPAKQVGKKNNLKYKYPDIAAEFDEKKNGVSSDSILAGSNKKFFWICSNCGNSYCTAASVRLSGVGCPECCESKGEKSVRNFLKRNKIKFVPQHRFEDCSDLRTLPFDFYLKKINCIIEYHGEQHYKPCLFFGGEKQFIIRKKHDEIKKNYCIKNNIRLIEIPYWEFKNIESILTKELNLIRKEDS